MPTKLTQKTKDIIKEADYIREYINAKRSQETQKSPDLNPLDFFLLEHLVFIKYKLMMLINLQGELQQHVAQCNFKCSKGTRTFINFPI